MPRSAIFSLFLCVVLAACATKVAPEDAQMASALCAQGKTLLASGKTAEARDIYASATHRDARNPRAWNGLGVADDMLGKRTEAEDAYKQALDLAPNDLIVMNNLAHLYIEMGNAEAAVELLQSHASDPASPVALRQNFLAAQKAASIKQAATSDTYADLGSYPTEGMAQGHLKEVRKLLGRDADDLTFAVEPELKTGVGIPVFTIKATGKSPQEICDELNPKAFPCVTRGN